MTDASLPVARHPSDIDHIICGAFESGDVALAMSLYEQGAAMVLPSGEITISRDAIRSEIEALVALKPTVTLDEVVAAFHEDGILATTRARGVINGTDPDGNPVTVPFHTLEVSRRQADGRWLLAIDDPMGSMRHG